MSTSITKNYHPKFENLRDRIVLSGNPMTTPLQYENVAAEIHERVEQIQIEHEPPADSGVGHGETTHETIEFPNEASYAVTKNGAILHVSFEHLPEGCSLLIKTHTGSFTMSLEEKCSVDLPADMLESASINMEGHLLRLDLSPTHHAHNLKEELETEEANEKAEINHILFEAAEYFHVIHEKEDNDEKLFEMAKEQAEHAAHMAHALAHAHADHDHPHTGDHEHKDHKHEHEEEGHEKANLPELEEETENLLSEYIEARHHGNGTEELKKLRHQIDHELKEVKKRIKEITTKDGKIIEGINPLHLQYMLNRKAKLEGLQHSLPAAPHNGREHAEAPAHNEQEAEEVTQKMVLES